MNSLLGKTIRFYFSEEPEENSLGKPMRVEGENAHGVFVRGEGGEFDGLWFHTWNDLGFVKIVEEGRARPPALAGFWEEEA